MKKLLTFGLLIFGLHHLILANEKPNILYLYVDDMGWGSIGPNGQKERKAKGKPYVMTPTLDRLAAEGINFRRAYGCTVCSPARSSQQTGFHQGYTFADRNDPDNAKKAIRTDDITIGDKLLQAGYTTGYWGKWGYGGSKDQNNPTLDNIQTLPTSHGYQYVVAELHHVRAHTFFQPTLWTAPAPSGTKGGLVLKPNTMAPFVNNKAYPDYPSFQNHPDYPKTAYCDDVYATAALDFIRQQAMNYNKTGKPFFGLFAAQIPHAPFDEVTKLPEWDKQYRDKSYFKSLNKQSQQWCAMVTRIDAHFGNLLAALEDPNGDGDKSDSVADNTLIIFQSDNGGPGGASRSELDANGGLSGTKGSIQEGGIRVPTIMRWPAKIHQNSKLKAGSNSDLVIDCTDFLPTFCELAGVDSPVGINGVSLAPYLTGKGEQRVRDFLIHEAGNFASIIKGYYKLVRSRTGKAGKGKVSKKKNSKGSPALYNLKNDPAEKNNIAGQFPELVKELNELLTAEMVDESAGFANTYHKWLGEKSKSLNSSGNWSDYIYENAGVKYMSEKGSPKPYWVVQIANGKDAVADSNVEFLGLEIGGGKIKQKVSVNKDITLTGRNEIRVASRGELILEGGELTSMRWIEIGAEGTLKGYGKINGELFAGGTLITDGKNPLIVKRKAFLSGELKVDSNSTLSDQFTVIHAESVKDKFTNSEISFSGKTYKLVYTKNSVELRLVK